MTTIIAIEQPIWENVEAKDRIRAGFVFEDGRRLVMVFPVDESNEEYQTFLALSSIEEVDANTQKLRDKAAEQRAKVTAQQTEKAEQKRANTLFNAKIEAFEMPIVQNAPTEMKARIRKATTTIEVVATVAMLMMKEESNNAPVGGASE